MKVISIFGVPRSGTSWLGQLFNSSPIVSYKYQPLFSYAFKNRLNSYSTRNDILQFYNDLINSNDEFVNQTINISGNNEIQFPKHQATHLVWKEVRYLNLIEHILKNSDTKFIFIIRHPCAVISSWIQAPKEFNSTWKIEEEWFRAEKKNQFRAEEYYGYERWKNAYQLFIRLSEIYPERVKIVKYEKLVIDTLKEVTGLFKFAEIPLLEQTINFINESKSKNIDDPYGVFKVKDDINEWKKKLPEKIADQIIFDMLTSNINYDE